MRALKQLVGCATQSQTTNCRSVRNNSSICQKRFALQCPLQVLRCLMAWFLFACRFPDILDLHTVSKRFIKLENAVACICKNGCNWSLKSPRKPDDVLTHSVNTSWEPVADKLNKVDHLAVVQHEVKLHCIHGLTWMPNDTRQTTLHNKNTCNLTKSRGVSSTKFP